MRIATRTQLDSRARYINGINQIGQVLALVARFTLDGRQFQYLIVLSAVGGHVAEG
jgi:hypothetical protein